MHQLLVSNRELLTEAVAGLCATPKRMRPKWFYDHVGSELFERITELPEYYPTRTEVLILRKEVETLAPYVPEGAALVELGSGASTKTRILLDAMDGLNAYVPVDVSGDFLQAVARDVDRLYPDLTIAPLVGDFLQHLKLPAVIGEMPKVGFFPGSTIGNLELAEAQDLLRRIRTWPNIAALVLGVDLVKDPEVLIRAYDDTQGVTAAFNRNLLHRLNREAGTNFDAESFDHEARWNPELSRIEMHLVSRAAQKVRLDGRNIQFRRGESIHTESSHKYTRRGVDDLAAKAGWRVAEFLTDPHKLFAVAMLVPADRPSAQAVTE
jgi:dimethylhistidine N-methyltransferase